MTMVIALVSLIAKPLEVIPSSILTLLISTQCRSQPRQFLSCLDVRCWSSNRGFPGKMNSPRKLVALFKGEERDLLNGILGLLKIRGFHRANRQGLGCPILI